MSLTPHQYWRHGRTVLRQQGFAALCRLILRKSNHLVGRYQQGDYDFGYSRWRQWFCSPRRIATEPDSGHTFSIIIPVYDIGERWLAMTVDSVLNQTYAHWHCLLVNDCSPAPHINPLLERLRQRDSRIKVLNRDRNGGIAAASQTGVDAATGDFIALLDHDDLLAPDALMEMARQIEREPDADLIYSDEDKIDTRGRHSSPFFKPDYSPELLESQNYIGHFLVIRRSLMNSIGGFRPGLDGAQDYDLVLRASRRAARISHVPRVLYHWRQIAGSTALGHDEKDYAADAGRQALQHHLDNTLPGATAVVAATVGTYHVTRPLPETPLVSVVIPFRDQPALLDRCLAALFRCNSWPNLEVICVDNQSIDPQVKVLRQRWQATRPSIRFIDFDQPFNFAAICNVAVNAARGEFVVLLNNDVEVITHGWIELLLGHAVNPGVGAVGARLSYPEGRVQHAGIVIGIGGSAGHAFKNFPDALIGYYGRLQIASNVSAVTGALMMVRKKHWLQIDGMDESRFAIAFNDVDLCLRLADAGYRQVLEPRCRGIHAESQSRGRDSDGDRVARFNQERAAFQDRWAHVLADGDPFYNPNLTLDAEDYSLNWQPLPAND